MQVPANVEERIVAAKFDSSQFEKGVNKTIKKLDELKKNLNFDKSGESIAELGKKTSEATESASKSLEKLSDRFTSFTGMLKQKFLSGIADQVVGAFFKMEQAVISFVKSMTFDQISVGMSKYEQMLTSARLITNAFYKDIKTGERMQYSEDQAYAALEKVRTYSDETSYSITQMTSAMSQMVNAGVSLDDAVKNVQGIANAAAAAGVNANDAARAFFNLSQAFSSGSLKYTDYKSLQLLNMTNENFENELLAAAEAQGTLKKVKEGVWKTNKSKTNKKVTAGKTVTRKNLADSLKYGFVDNETMSELFGKRFFVNVEDYFSAKEKFMNEQNMSSIEASKKAYEELEQKYSKVAVAAFKSAREARNFNDVMNTIKDNVSTSWSKIMDILFGKLEKAAEFFTSLSEGETATFFYDLMKKIEDAFTLFDAQMLDGRSGGDIFREAITNLDAALGNFLGIFLDLIPEADTLGEALFILSRRFREATGQVAEWVAELREWWNGKDEEDEAITRMDKLRIIIGNLGSSLGIAGKVIAIVSQAINDALKALSPILSAVLNAMMELTKPISDLNNNTEAFNSLRDAAQDTVTPLEKIMEIVGPAIRKMGELIGIIGGFFVDMSLSGVVMNIQFFADVLGSVLEAIGLISNKKNRTGKSTLDEIADSIKELGDACAKAKDTVKQFFATLLADIRNILGLPNETATNEAIQNGGIFAGIKNFFETNEFIKDAENWVERAKKDITTWFNELPGKINKFINDLLYEKSTRPVFDKNGANIANEVVYTSVGTPLKQWLDGAIETVSNFIVQLPSKVLSAIGKGFDLIGTVVNTIFGSSGEQKKSEKENETKSVDAIKEWADKFSDKFQKELKRFPVKFRNFIWQQSIKVRRALRDIRKWWDTSDIAKSIKEFADTMITEFKKFILDLPKNLKNIIHLGGDIGRTIIGIFKDLFKAKDVTEATESEIDKAFKNISLTSVLDTIADLGKEVANQFLSWFTGSEDMEANFKWLQDNISGWFQSIPSTLSNVVNIVVKELGELWNRLFSALIGQRDESGKVTQPIDSRVKEELDKLTNKDGSLSVGIENIIPILRAAFDDAITVVNGLWDKLVDAITGRNKKDLTTEMRNALSMARDDKQRNDMINGFLKEGYKVPGVKTGFEKFSDDFGKLVGDIFTNLPQWITDGLNTAVKAIDDAFVWLTEHLSANLENTEENVADSDKAEKGSLQESFVKLGKTISGLIFDTIPKAITTGFELVKTKASEWIKVLTGIFDDINNDPLLQEKVNSIGDSIVNWIEKIPARIRSGFASLSLLLDKAFGRKQDAMIVGKDTRFFLNNAGDETEKEAEKSTLWGSIKKVVGQIGDALETAFDDLWPDIEKWFSELPTHIANGLNSAIEEISKAIGNVSDWFEKNSNPEAMAKAAKGEVEETTDAAIEGAADGATDAKADSPFKKAILQLGANLWTLITTEIPKAIRSGFDWVSANWNAEGGWRDSLLNIFSQVTGIKPGEISVDNIVKNIEDALKSIPEQLTSAWAWVKVKIRELFGLGNTSEDILGLGKGPLSEEAIKKALEGKGGESKSNVNPFTESLMKSLPKPQELSADLKKKLDESGKAMEQASEGSNLFDALLGIGTDIGNTITSGIQWALNKIGPILLDAWNNTLSLWNTLFSGLASWFANGSKSDELGDELSKSLPEGTSDGIREGINTIGKTIENFIVNTIPDFIGSGLATIISGSGEFIRKVFASFERTTNEIAEQEGLNDPEKTNSPLDFLKNAFGGLTEILTGILNFFVKDGKLTAWGTIAIALGGVLLVINLIADIKNKFHDAGAAADKWEAKNSPLGIMRSLINFMSLAMILAGVASQLNDDQFDKVEKIIDKVVEIIDKITPMIYVLAALQAGPSLLESLADIIGLFKHKKVDVNVDYKNTAEGIEQVADAMPQLQDEIKKTADVAADASNSAGDFDGLDGLISTITGPLGTLLKGGAIGTSGFIIGESLTSVFKDAIGDFDLLGVALASVKGRIDTAFGNIEETMASIQRAIDCIGKANELIGLVIEMHDKRNDLTNGLTQLDRISTSLTLLATPFQGELHLGDFVQALKDLMGLQGTITEFVKFTRESTDFSEFKYAIASLGTVLSFFNLSGLAEADKISDEQINAAVDVLSRLLSNEGMADLISKVSPDNFGSTPAQLSQGTEMLILFASGLSRMADAASGFTKDSKQNLLEFFGALDALTINTNDTADVALSKNLITLASGLKQFTDEVANIEMNDDNLRYAMNILDNVATLASRLSFIGHGPLMKLFIEGTSLQTFGEQLAILGEKLQSFMSYMRPTDADAAAGNNWVMENVSTAMYAVTQLAAAASKIDETNTRALINLFSEDSKLADSIMLFMTKLTRIHDVVDAKGNKYKISYEALDFDSISQVLSSFNSLASSFSLFRNVNLAETLNAFSGHDSWRGKVNKSMAEAIGEIIGVFTFITGKMRELTDTSESSGLSKIDLDQVNSFLDILKNFIGALSSMYDYLATDRSYMTIQGEYLTVNMDTLMTQMMLAIETLTNDSGKIFEMIDKLATYDNSESFEKAKSVLALLKEIGLTFALFGTESFSLGMNGDQYVENGIMNGLNAFERFAGNNAVLTTALDQVIHSLDDVLMNEQNTESLKTSGKTMATYLFQGIQEAFNDPEMHLQPEITPVLNDTQLRADMAALFGIENPSDFSFGTGFSEAVQRAFTNTELNQPIDYTDQINAATAYIGDSISNLSHDIGYIADALNGMGVYIDKSVLVGEIAGDIDAIIGHSGILHARHNATNVGWVVRS